MRNKIYSLWNCTSGEMESIFIRSPLDNATQYFGGSIYNLLFNEIIGNFNHDDERDLALIKMVLLMEQILIEEKILDDDYAVIIAEKK